MESVKVLHVIRPAEGGMKEHLLALVNNLNQQPFQVMIACPEEGRMAPQLRSQGHQVFTLDLPGELVWNKDWRAILFLIRLMKREKITLVHCHGSKAGLVGRIAALLAGVPVILFTAHNSIFYDFLPSWKKKLFALVEKGLAYGSDGIIAVSGAIRDILVQTEKIPPAKVVTIYNGIDTQRFRDPGDLASLRKDLGLAEGPVVGAVARLAPQKGLNYFLLAAAEVAKKFPHCRFLIIGDGPLRGFLEKLAGKLGLASRVSFLGYRQDVSELLYLMDVMVLSSLTEGLPLTLLEAMAAGRPVVSTAVGGIPEVVNHGVSGILVPPGDSQALAAGIIQLLRDPEQATALGNAGRRTVQKRYSLTGMVERTMELYSRSLANKGLWRGEDSPVLE